MSLTSCMKVPSSAPNPATGSCHCAIPGQMTTDICTMRRWQRPARLHGTLLSLPWATRPRRWKSALTMPWRLRPVVSGWLLTLSLQGPGSGSGDGHNKVSLTCVCPRGALPQSKIRLSLSDLQSALPSPGAPNHRLKAALSIRSSWETAAGNEKMLFSIPVGWIPNRRFEGPAVFSEKKIN